MDDHISFEFAVYVLPNSTADPMVVATKLMANRFKALEQVETLTASPSTSSAMEVAIRLEEDASSNYVPPDLESLKYFGRGLSSTQAEHLQNSNSAIVLTFGLPKKQLWEGLRLSCELVSMLAREIDGLVWDDETREIFTADAWEAKRLTSWTDEIPNVSDHTIIHAYNTGKHVRAITLGMRKFGLPDVVVDGFSWSLNRNMGNLINLLAQAMAEGTTRTAEGEFDLDLKAIKNASVREPQLASLGSNATKKAKLVLGKGIWEEGDPNNRLLEIAFDRYEGPDAYAKQEALLSSLFGWEDSVKAVSHDDQILAASKRAKSKLPLLRTDFSKGLAPGEFILVKAPFETPDGGHEWMWVEIIAWNNEEIRGLLKNEPHSIPNLHGGQEVTVAEGEVFDYIRRFSNGTQEGNETGEFISRQRRNAE